MNLMKDKVLVITGGSSGIGAATAKLAAKQGAQVVIGARNEQQLQKAATANPERISYQVTDVTDQESVKALIQFAITKFGKVDILYNNAGIMPQGLLRKNKADSWQKMLNINVMGVLNGIAAVLPSMKEQGHGLIMATDSVAGHVLYQGSAVYNGTKFAVRAIMEGLRQEEHANNIKTGIISPGAVETNLLSTVGDDDIKKAVENANQQKNGALSAEDVAQSAVFMMNQPENVDINEILVRPTGQNV
ncbi:SDR family oxidoreductase [Fructilactobacillus florum]|uniref:Short-chain dehydrogenase oxidoreductase n=1 Tax=Fructilactobacillus florum DSM 22689 = JCM 16035 TaxID=1423745 RepID=A0A0R2CDM3_9LACO|nr:SDR family oxidoreductase [Fructilactobacillus florum]KRM89800.1 short-chain dehydrogenase oxidoreductase [Fructilactobacillus florum DSM 22689 = JCM 16035]